MCHLPYFVYANKFLDDSIHKWALSHFINIWVTERCGVHVRGLQISALSLNFTCLCQTCRRSRAIGHTNVAPVLICSLCTRIGFSLFVLTPGPELLEHLTTDEFWDDVWTCVGYSSLPCSSLLLSLSRNTKCPRMFVSFYIK